MKKYWKLTKQAVLAVSVLGLASLAAAQTTNTVVAKYGTPPDAGNKFTVNLVNEGETKEIAGFSFRVSYNPAQVSLLGVADNTGQKDSGLQYGFGPETIAEDGTASRVVLATTLKNLNNAGNLAELKFEKKAGYAGPLQLQITDRLTGPVIDGLQGPDVQNVPHVFDTTQLN